MANEDFNRSEEPCHLKVGDIYTLTIDPPYSGPKIRDVTGRRQTFTLIAEVTSYALGTETAKRRKFPHVK